MTSVVLVISKAGLIAYTSHSHIVRPPSARLSSVVRKDLAMIQDHQRRGLPVQASGSSGRSTL